MLGDAQPFAEPFSPQTYVPETPSENARRSGLAWSAGIVFFSSIAFTLLLGWIGDLLLGTSPWGLVGGIVLGSIMGFIQFFRITSQIFKSKNEHSGIQPLLRGHDDDHPPESLDA
jgi:F0F1-type ATP synthase assembly protein I